MLNMKKGDKLSLKKAGGGDINSLRVELSWSPQVFASGRAIDLDASAIALIDNGDPNYPFGRAHSEAFTLYFNSETRTEDGKSTFMDLTDPSAGKKKGMPATPDCAMVHSGDSRDGSADGPDETIILNLNRLPQDVNLVHIPVTIFEAKERNQHFGMVKDSKVEIYNHETNQLLACCELEQDPDMSTALLFVEVRKDNGWKVIAANQGFKKDLGDFFSLYGLM